MIDQSIGPFFYEFRLWKTGLLISIVRSVICSFFFLFSFIYSVIHSTFLNCLTVATNVLGRTHTLKEPKEKPSEQNEPKADDELREDEEESKEEERMGMKMKKKKKKKKYLNQRAN